MTMVSFTIGLDHGARQIATNRRESAPSVEVSNKKPVALTGTDDGGRGYRSSGDLVVALAAEDTYCRTSPAI